MARDIESCTATYGEPKVPHVLDKCDHVCSKPDFPNVMAFRCFATPSKPSQRGSQQSQIVRVAAQNITRASRWGRPLQIYALTFSPSVPFLQYPNIKITFVVYSGTSANAAASALNCQLHLYPHTFPRK